MSSISDTTLQAKAARIKEQIRLRKRKQRHPTIPIPSVCVDGLLRETPEMSSAITNFRQTLMSLQNETCGTCSESFPGLRILNEMCFVCTKNPTIYTSLNLMDPGKSTLHYIQSTSV